MSADLRQLAPAAKVRGALTQTLWLTVAAALLYVGIRSLPVDGGALHYDDFHAGGQGLLEFCAPGGPQFVPVDRVRSPVSMALRVAPGDSIDRGQTLHLAVTLTSASGKPVAADDLLIVHTQKLHLLVIDPSLDDYQHLHPVATSVPGEYAVEFTPWRTGEYRVFADFTPRATGRALYAGAAIQVRGDLEGGVEPGAPAHAARAVDVGVFRFSLEADRKPLRINETATLSLTVHRLDGEKVQLEEIMGAFAHVVAFDRGRTGFAHLHPLVSDARADGGGSLAFQLQLTDPGTYRLWAQVKAEGRELFAPFDVAVVP